MIRYRIRSPKPRKKSPVIREMIAQGIMIPPVPSTGRISKMAMQTAIRMAFGTRSTVRPMEISVKVMNRISA